MVLEPLVGAEPGAAPRAAVVDVLARVHAQRDEEARAAAKRTHTMSQQLLVEEQFMDSISILRLRTRDLQLYT